MIDFVIQYPMLNRIRQIFKLMNTPTHLIMSAVLFAKPEQRKVTAAALLGGFAPDFSLYFMFFWHQFILATPTKKIFDELYFSDYWQKIFAIDNSFIVWGIFLGLSLFQKSGWMIAISGAAFVHLLCDFPLHVDDARAHFWPLTMWKFESSISYWDNDHHGSFISILEIILVCVMLSVLWKRFDTLITRSVLVLSAMIMVIPLLVYNSTLGLGQ